jgi:carboxymethylenebutenolidase
MDRLSEEENWVAHSGVGRRALLGGGAAALGYALAARPVMATAITTPADGLVAGRVEVPAGDIAMQAYRARPEGKRRAPVIIVVPEIFGLHAWIEDVTRRLALAGYYAIAPDPFQRQGDPTKVADTKTLFSTIISKVPDAQVMADLDSTLAFAGSDGGNAEKPGITGFCWGGRITWLYAAHRPGLKAGVAWYGRLTGATNTLQTSQPIALVDRLKAPVLGLYGTRDKGIPVSDVEQMNEALQAIRSKSVIRLFDADHGFLADYRASYDAAAAAAAWTQALAWFRRFL